MSLDGWLCCCTFQTVVLEGSFAFKKCRICLELLLRLETCFSQTINVVSVQTDDCFPIAFISTALPLSSLK